VPPPAENAQPAGNLTFAGRVQSAAAQAADEQTAAKLQRSMPEIKFDNVPLKDALDFFRDVTQVDFFIDAKGLEAAGVDASATVTLNARNLPAEQALALLLRSASPNVGYTIDGGVVYVSARDEVAQKVITRVYPVAGLENPGGRATLEQLIRDTVAPETWRESGGSTGVIVRYGGKLVVTTTEPNHREVKKLLDLLQDEAKGRDGGDHEAPATGAVKK
jgi:type II secretory pathway component GspD/PulD (secretin)